MINTLRSRRGMVTSPHHLASQAGLSVLREGGTAIEATVAVASVLSVVYPHMLSIGGDAFWLVGTGKDDPIAIEACGAAGSKVDTDLYRGHDAIPSRGPLAANTVAGAISGWAAALDVSRRWGGKLPLARLLEDAIYLAEHGVPVSDNQANVVDDIRAELAPIYGFAPAFAPGGVWPKAGATLKQPALARTLKRLAEVGLEDFYRGELAKTIAADLAKAGSPLLADDLARHRPQERAPLSITTSRGTIYNFPPPTQGIAALLILGQFDRLNIREAEGFDHIHALIEASKQAYQIRDRIVGDPAYMKERVDDYLMPTTIDKMAAAIDMKRAKRIKAPTGAGDTAWMGAIDGAGRAASHIQSVFMAFGSGVVLNETGIVWQNRGASFSLDAKAVNPVMPGRKPFHTLNPAMAKLKDGRFVTYGTMGAHGQPQFSSAVFSRYAWFDQPFQTAVTAPRWFVDGDKVLTENRVDPSVVAQLRAAGHEIELAGPFVSFFGHAHGIAHHPDGTLEGAVDPRSDGIVAAF
ncbi:MAG TPA: gamma-glutamyltransferase [Magnetospirillaceae bacterium]|jgi:gamma-glutamyltranspeptidase/glutathione hydrolase